MLLATTVTLLVTPPTVLAALLVFRALTAPTAPSRHRLGGVAEPYRPRPAAARAITTGPVPVIPGSVGPEDTGVINVRDMATPIPAQRPLTPEMKALAEAIEADHAAAHSEALREDWARSAVAAEGERWETHMVKFDGTVLPREQPLDEKTREVARIS